ncbi:MAG: NAD(P)-dependent oxidoreductase [Pseudomonadota bacterium]
MKVGFIGLGAMGAPIAGHLAAVGLLHAVWNRSIERAAEFVARYPQVIQADSPAALAGQVDVMLICVSADADVIDLLEAMRPQLRPGQIVVDHSTVAPQTAQHLAESLLQRGLSFIDAPVTGGVEGAMNGQLAIMAGGDVNAFERLEPVFEAYGKVWRHLGPAGAGQSAKAVNQLMVAGIAEAVCEALALVERLNLPQQDMLELLGGGAAGNWFLDKRGKTMLADSFETGFDPKLMLKDLRICSGLTEQRGFTSSVLAAALADYARLVESGEMAKDISALIRLKRSL